ncbi:anti-sigma factor antagonist [Streptomyces anthocyanicus]|uniref:Anti-sigma factor antagonist n=2 Tax=Streptomyces TaxID=1883 RepID=Q9X8X4_STRCO|nr:MULTISPECIES: STAS domain-containing protein [Streptomyces]MDX2924538.1 STAS domain-containing protein [Streptomyces sp. NRRL_B-16638]MDX3365727.1 STAS domain-containing protein [Streptomyces sp. ME02-6987-2C]MDX3407263.1 STAS domain-containing protein [Streptomyces sp. ME02-6977A]MDX3425706.1 STAS domain-containing protein [Streptomyces sp. ME02-6985-2c]MYU43216.1 anti-sigma factor antagonist [Streptomyces sp. SID7813]
MSKYLTVRVRTGTAGAVIELTGELDHHTAADVRDTLPGLGLQPGQQLVLDLAGLTFLDSTGLTVLIAARNHALATDATIALAAVPDRVSRIIRVLGLNQFFPTHPTAQDADTAWQSEQR